MKVRVAVLVLALAAVVAVTTACEPKPTSDGLWNYHPLTVNGAYRPVVGDFAGDRASDVFWYGPGDAADSLWVGRSGKRGAAGFTKQTFTVGNDYTPVVGDFAGDEREDILWHRPGAGADRLWVNDGNGRFTGIPLDIDGSFRLFRLRDWRDGKKDDLYLQPTGTSNLSYLWHFDDAASGSHTEQEVLQTTPKRTVVLDWNGDGLDDLMNHGFVSYMTDRWTMKDDGTYTYRGFQTRGNYRPVTITAIPNDGILFFGGQSNKEAYWSSDGKEFTSHQPNQIPVDANVATLPVGAAIIWGTKLRDAIFIAEPDGSGGTFYDLADGAHDMGNELPLVGDFDGDGWADIVWYGTGSARDQVWYLEGENHDGLRSSRAAGPRPAPATPSTPAILEG